MSLVDVRTYFKTKLNGLGFTQWTDAFDFQNIPNTVLDKNYFLETKTFSRISQNQIDLNLKCDVNVIVFLKGYRNLDTAYTESLSKALLIIKELTKISNAKTQSNIKNVNIESFDISPLDAASDNLFMINMSFSALLLIDVNN